MSTSVRWRVLLDARVRQHICPSGEGVFRADLRKYPLTVVPQDKNDDINVGIRSTALLFGEQTRPILSALSASAVSLITYAGFVNAQGAPFYLGVGLGAAQLARILWRTDFDNRASCWQGFVGCGWTGFWVWTGALADYVTVISGTL